MNTVIIAAAGSGSRMKSKIKKQFLVIDKIAVLARTLMSFSESKLIDNIIISAGKDDYDGISGLINDYRIEKVKKITEGGATRQQSVFNALKETSGDELVLIHDAVRPFFTEGLVERLIAAAFEYGAAAPGLIPRDTVSEIDGDGFFKTVLNRTALRNMQTPQVFKAELIKAAHLKAKEEGVSFTDDCSLYRYYGGQIRIIDGEEDNIKITVPRDLESARLILARSNGGK